MQALFVLGFDNSLYLPQNYPPTTTVAIQAFGNYAEAAARHFAGHGIRYEIWNEPNTAQFWSPQPNPTQYAALAKEAIARVHIGDPAAQVTTGDLHGEAYAFLRAFLAAGGGAEADAIGMHLYRSNDPIPPPEMAPEITLMERLIVGQMLPANPPLWQTEWGYSSTWPAGGNGHSPEARRRQAVMVARQLLSAWSLGFPLIMYYDILDNGPVATNKEHNFGLLAQNNAEKPAMQAVRALTTAAAGRQFTGFLPVAVDGANLSALRLDGVADVVVVVWSRLGQATVHVPPGTTAANLFGEPLALQSAGGQFSLVVSEAAGPVYLTFPKSPLFLPVIIKQ